MAIEVMRATQLWQQAGAYSVRIQGMGRQHHIPLSQEFDEHDGPDTRYIVLLDDGYPVATCRLYALTGGDVMLGRVVVLPEYRGCGLGRQTMEEAERWARELGFARIVLESRVGKVAFYEKLGYLKQSGDIIHGDTFDCVSMTKALLPGAGQEVHAP